MKESEYKDILSSVFYNRTSECYGMYKVQCCIKNDIFQIKFKDTANVDNAKYSDIINNTVIDNKLKNKKSKTIKSKTGKNIPSNQFIDFNVSDKDINIKIVIDSREQSTDYLNLLTPDIKRKSDNTKIVGYGVEAVKPLGCSVSTGDLTYNYQKGNNMYRKTNFCAELKRGLDLFSSLYTTANYNRLIKELDRAKAANLDFYMMNDLPLDELVEKIKRLESKYVNGRYRKGKLVTNAHIIFLEKYLLFNEELSKRGFPQIITAGNNIWYIVRRLIKRNLKETLKSG